jgi:hypothetical protein
MNVKPGVKTTEFWLTIINTVAMVLVSTGLLSPNEVDEWQELATPLVLAVIPIAVYIWSRGKVKTA